MLDKAIKAVIESGRQELERLLARTAATAREAGEQVERAKADINGLAKMAEDVSAKALERFQGILTTEFVVYDSPSSENPSLVLQVGHGGHHLLRGMLGADKIEHGKYRALVLIERIGPLEEGR